MSHLATKHWGLSCGHQSRTTCVGATFFSSSESDTCIIQKVTCQGEKGETEILKKRYTTEAQSCGCYKQAKKYFLLPFSVFSQQAAVTRKDSSCVKTSASYCSKYSRLLITFPSRRVPSLYCGRKDRTAFRSEASICLAHHPNSLCKRLNSFGPGDPLLKNSFVFPFVASFHNQNTQHSAPLRLKSDELTCNLLSVAQHSLKPIIWAWRIYWLPPSLLLLSEF